jgi:hypothetical protein
MTDYEKAVVKRLRQLQRGANPAERNHGICYDLRFNIPCTVHGYVNPYMLVREKSVELGLGGDPVYYGPNPWTEPYATLRRKFAGLLADYIEGKPVNEAVLKELRDAKE